MNGYETYDSTCDVCDACGAGNGALHTAECPDALAQDEADGTDVTDDEMKEDIVAMIEEAGYGPKEIKKGIAYAKSIGYETDEEYFSLIMSRILYGKDQLDEGARFGVEPGSLG